MGPRWSRRVMAPWTTLGHRHSRTANARGTSLHRRPDRHADRPSSRARALLWALALSALVGVGGAMGAGGASAAEPADPTATPTPTPTPTPAPPDGPTVLGPTVTFHGRGYGHGVGMSQYGARGRALEGQATADILAHYYRGTTLGTLDPPPADPGPRPQPAQDLEGKAARHLRPTDELGDRRDRPGLSGRRPAHPDAHHEGDRVTGIDLVAPPGVRPVRREAAERSQDQGVRRPGDRGDRPAPAVVEAEHLRPVPWHAAGHPEDHQADRQRREPSGPRAVPARRRPRRDAIDLADGRAPGAGDRLALVCRPQAPARRLLLRHRRRHRARRCTGARRRSARPPTPRSRRPRTRC